VAEVEPEPAVGSEPAAEPEPVAEPEPAAEPEPVEEPRPAWERVTDKGLPKRTPKVVKPAAAPSERAGSVDADALRRRLGGFHQGAKDGRRDAEAEIAEIADQTERDAGTEAAEAGDTVEEARS
jgi:hypothetical protein